MHTNNGKKKEKAVIKSTLSIGASCNIKGSRQVVEQLQDLIRGKDLDDRVELAGTFCMGQCQNGVCVTVDDAFYSVSPDTVPAFFDTAVVAKL